MIICFILKKNNLFCENYVRRIYILINWLGLRGLKSDSLIWVLDVFAIAFRIYPKGPLICYETGNALPHDKEIARDRCYCMYYLNNSGLYMHTPLNAVARVFVSDRCIEV